MIYLGIDFGTIWTKAALYDSEKKTLSPVYFSKYSDSSYVLDVSKYALPTAVFYSADLSGYMVGREAVNARLSHPDLFFHKFKPALSGNNEYADEKLNITYRDLVTEILKYVKQKAEDILGDGNIDRCVITVPADTSRNDNRWNIMSAAARCAGLPDFRFMAEPVAAGYYAISERIKECAVRDNSLFLVYDFGGGTFDCSLLAYRDKQIRVIADKGSGRSQLLGGIYIDDKIRKDLRQRSEVLAILEKKDDKKSRQSLYKWLNETPIEAKHSLSEEDSYDQMGYVLTRSDFETMIAPIINDTVTFTKMFVDGCKGLWPGASLETLDSIVLAGGSSMIPLVEKKLNELKESKAEYEFEIVKCPALDNNVFNGMVNAVSAGAALCDSLTPEPAELVKMAEAHSAEGEYEIAAALYQQADTPGAKYRLGMLYYLGQLGVKRDYIRAIRQFTDSYKDYDDSRIMLGLMYFNGEGVLKNDETAKQYVFPVMGKKGASEWNKDRAQKLLDAIEGTAAQKDLEYIYSTGFLSP